MTKQREGDYFLMPGEKGKITLQASLTSQKGGIIRYGGTAQT